MLIFPLLSVKPNRFIELAIWLGSPKSVIFTISWLSKRCAAFSMRSSFPSGKTMCLMLLFACLANLYWNMCGVIPSDLKVIILSFKVFTSTYFSNVSMASLIFLSLPGVIRDWIPPSRVLVSNVPVGTAIMGMTDCEPFIKRIIGSSGSEPADKTMPATFG